MPKFSPFKALRYAPGIDLDAVIAPPYDVLSDADIAELKGRDAHNIVHVDVPAGGDLSLGGTSVSPSAELYTQAGATLHEWVAAGILVQDESPSYTIYRMSFTDATGTPREVVGVLGGLEVVDVGAGGVLPHERTTPKAVTDRLDLTRGTATNLSPVWGLSLATGLTSALAAPGEFLGELRVDNVLHRVERVSDPTRVAEITAILAADDVLIADGHHRYAISRTYRDEVRAATGRDDTAAEYTLAFINELSGDQLSIEAIHRLYNGICADHLRGVLAKSFDIEPISETISTQTLRDMSTLGRLVLLTPGESDARTANEPGTANETGAVNEAGVVNAEWLIPKPAAFAEVRALDGAYLEHALRPLEQDPQGSDIKVSYQHGLEEMLQIVSGGAVSAGILIRPSSLTEIERTAREGLLMPPKSTFFIPKLRTGLVIRPTQPLADTSGWE